MLDWFDWEWWHSLREYSLWLMFASAFLSATLLPGNSEIVFVGFATPLIWSHSYFSLSALLISAVAGNSLGSLTTYWVGRCLPQAQQRDRQNPRYRWALQQTQKYGTWILLFSWLPIIGDLFCAVAGWLRLNGLTSLLFITLGKLVRYVFLIFLSSGMFG